MGFIKINSFVKSAGQSDLIGTEINATYIIIVKHQPYSKGIFIPGVQFHIKAHIDCTGEGDIGVIQHIAPLVHVRYHLYQRQVHVFITPTLAPENKATELLMQAYSSAFYALLKRLSQGYPHCHFDFACKRPRHMYEFEHNLGTRLRFAQPVYKWSFAASMLRCTNDNASLLRWQRL